MTETESRTHFGFEDIDAREKAPRVQGVFRSVAENYDLMNDVMSGGAHRLWKNAMIDWLAPRPGMAMLDVAGGTGDIAFRMLDRTPSAHVTVCDLTHAMLVAGRGRPQAATHAPALSWVTGDALRLPFADASFDAYTIAFGIRNVTDVDQALREAFRVLRPGGRFLCLEFSHVTTPGFDRAYEAYSFNAIPRLGELIAKDRDSYQYLVESIRKFPDQETFAGMIGDAGFEQVRVRNLTMGIAALHSGWKI